MALFLAFFGAQVFQRCRIRTDPLPNPSIDNTNDQNKHKLVTGWRKVQVVFQDQAPYRRQHDQIQPIPTWSTISLWIHESHPWINLIRPSVPITDAG